MFDVTVISQQHVELVSLFNKLNEAVKKNESRQDIYKIIEDIISLTCTHFADEEHLMVKSGYPEVNAHKKMHKELVGEALHLKGKFDYVDDETFTEWLNHWPFGRVLAHIQYADKQFDEHIKQKNLVL